MSTSYRLAVILAVEEGAQGAPTLEDCRRFVETGEDSVLAYWRDNAGDWFTISGVDYRGPVPIAGVPPKAGRHVVMDKAVAALSTPLAAHDLLLVLVAPNGGSYEVGASGRRALVPTTASHTFACHEFGHIVGLNHTCGILNTGGDWSDNGRPDFSPWYGDPYDLMSGMAFGDARPETELPETSAVPGFPSARIAGPMLSRAMLHHTAPEAIPEDRVRHVHQGQDVETVRLQPAGAPDGVVLMAWHPAGEDARGRGRVYVEYRQPFPHLPASRWDEGLAGAGSERDRRGVVVHVAKDVPGADYTAVWYAGRIILQSPDDDVEVDTGQGLVTVSVLPAPGDDRAAPVDVRVRVMTPRRPYVRLEETVQDQVTVTELDSRPLPGLEFAGSFPRERREIVRTLTCVPSAHGLGGPSPHDAPTAVRIRWYLGGQMLTGTSGQAERLPAGGTAVVRLGYRIDPDSGVLTLWNASVADAFSLDLECWAGELVSNKPSATAGATYQVEGTTEGWGEAARRFLDYWERITNPIPQKKLGPFPFDPRRFEADRLEQAWRDLLEVSPQSAQAVRQAHLRKLVLLRGLGPHV